MFYMVHDNVPNHFSTYDSVTASLGMVCKNLEEYLPWCHNLTLSKEMFSIIYSKCKFKAFLQGNQCFGKSAPWAAWHWACSSYSTWQSHPGKKRSVAKVGTQLQDYGLKIGYKYSHCTMLNWSKSKSAKNIYTSTLKSITGSVLLLRLFWNLWCHFFKLSLTDLGFQEVCFLSFCLCPRLKNNERFTGFCRNQEQVLI